MSIPSREGTTGILSKTLSVGTRPKIQLRLCCVQSSVANAIRVRRARPNTSGAHHLGHRCSCEHSYRREKCDFMIPKNMGEIASVRMAPARTSVLFSWRDCGTNSAQFHIPVTADPSRTATSSKGSSTRTARSSFTELRALHTATSNADTLGRPGTLARARSGQAAAPRVEPRHPASRADVARSERSGHSRIGRG